jgi:hypothetical protein
MRGRLWLALVARYDGIAVAADSAYSDLLGRPCIYRHAITQDLHRTFPALVTRAAGSVASGWRRPSHLVGSPVAPG